MSNQTLREIEILVVDLGSADGTLDIISEYARLDRRMRLLSDKSGSAGHAKNKAMDAAMVPFVVFIGAEDCADPDMLERMYGEFEDEQHLDVVLAETDTFGDGSFGKGKGGEKKRTKLTVTEVRKSNIRTVAYPEALNSYVAEFYKKGTVFLTGEQGHYIEQRTLSNRLEKVFAVRGLSGLTLQRLNRTYKDWLADVRYLTDPYYRSEDSASTVLEINEKWLLKGMENDLSSLRGLLGLSGGELGGVLGMTEDEYLALEAGETALDWQGFLSLLFFFRYNAKTEGVVDALGLYPNALREKLSICRIGEAGDNDRMDVTSADGSPGLTRSRRGKKRVIKNT